MLMSQARYPLLTYLDLSAKDDLEQARGYKTFFLLNSAEHDEIFSANKYENATIE